MKIFLNLLFLITFGNVFIGQGQTTRTSTTTGSLWFDAGAGWSAGVPDASDAVTFNNNAKATIQNAESSTIASLVTGNGAVITINSGGSLTVLGSMTTNNNTIINVTGTLTINGSLTVNNNLTWNITGNVIILGNVSLANNATLTVANTGTMDIGGNFVGGTNTNLVVDGSVNVDGTISVGNGSTATGAGTVSSSGCTDGTSTFCDQGPLPVELSSFKANSVGDAVTLDWSTATQLNFSHFEVEHSINANDWSVLAEVQGEGTTNDLMTYTYTHSLPHNGKNYYRLRMVDLDETFEYSDIESVQVNGKNAFSVSPNPSKGGIVRYEMNFTPSEGDRLFIYDLMGGFILSSTVSLMAQEFVLPNSLAKGTYLVRYKGQNVNQVVRLIVE
jgi:hypothetical protein